MLDVGTADYAEVLAHIFAHMLKLLCCIRSQVHAVEISEAMQRAGFETDQPHNIIINMQS